MTPLPFDIANNWQEHPELRRLVSWQASAPEAEPFIFEATLDARHWQAAQ